MEKVKKSKMDNEHIMSAITGVPIEEVKEIYEDKGKVARGKKLFEFIILLNGCKDNLELITEVKASIVMLLGPFPQKVRAHILMTAAEISLTGRDNEIDAQIKKFKE